MYQCTLHASMMGPYIASSIMGWDMTLEVSRCGSPVFAEPRGGRFGRQGWWHLDLGSHLGPQDRATDGWVILRIWNHRFWKGRCNHQRLWLDSENTMISLYRHMITSLHDYITIHHDIIISSYDYIITWLHHYYHEWLSSSCPHLMMTISVKSQHTWCFFFYHMSKIQ